MLRQGFIADLETIVSFVAVLPQFVSFGEGAIPLQMMGLMFASIGFIWDAVWAVLAGTAQACYAQSSR